MLMYHMLHATSCARSLCISIVLSFSFDIRRCFRVVGGTQKVVAIKAMQSRTTIIYCIYYNTSLKSSL